MKKPANIEVSVNDRVVSLTCKATGQPAPQITWRKDRQSLPQDGRHVVRADGTLDILEPKADDAGVYECMARNDAGLVISEASLRYEGIEGQYKFCGDVLTNQLTKQIIVVVVIIMIIIIIIIILIIIIIIIIIITTIIIVITIIIIMDD